MNNSKKIINILKDLNAIEEGHFLLSSGLHSDKYIEKFRILENPRILKDIIKENIEVFLNFKPDLVVGPTLGGALIAYQVAEILEIKAFYAEKNPPGGRMFRRGFDISPFQSILIVDDILTTGKSIKETADLIGSFGKTPKGAVVLVKRSEELAVKFAFPVIPLGEIYIKSYKPDECPLCKLNIPIMKPGGLE